MCLDWIVLSENQKTLHIILFNFLLKQVNKDLGLRSAVFSVNDAPFHRKIPVHGDVGEIGNIKTILPYAYQYGVLHFHFYQKFMAVIGVSQLREMNQNINGDITNIRGDINRLDSRIDKVGAGAAALAGLHPLDFDPDEKWHVAAGVGSYGNETAVALGAFYQPTDDVLFNVATTLGDGRNMVSGGVSIRTIEKDTLMEFWNIRNAKVNVYMNGAYVPLGQRCTIYGTVREDGTILLERMDSVAEDGWTGKMGN